MITLYYSPGACSLAPHIALMESGLKFQAKRVDLKTKEISGGGNFLTINPKGYVPTLQLEDGTVLTEGAVLLQYIADQKPEKNLMPKFGTLERYKAQEWLNYVSTEVHKAFSPLWNPATPEEYKKMATDNLFKKFDFLNTHFQKNDFLMGKQVSVADFYLFNVVSWSKYLKLDLSKYSSLNEFMKRIQDRPATKEAMIAEGILK
jgi:glutathione S-transferase